MKKFLLIFMSVVFLFSLTGCKVAHATSPIRPSYSDEGRGIIFENHDKVKIANEVLDIEFNDKQKAKITATYNIKNVTGESLSINNMFLYQLNNEIDKEVKVLRNGAELDYDIEYFGKNGDNIDWTDDWETILSENDYNSRPLGDGSGFVEYAINSVDEVFSFVPEDFYFTENFYLNGNGELMLAQNESHGKIITRQAPEFNDCEYTSAAIENIYDYLEDYYKNKGYYDLLATTLSKSALYNVDRNKQAREDFEFLYFNSLDEYGDIHSNLDWEPLSQTLGDGSGFFEYTFHDMEEEFSFIPSDYYFTDDFHPEKIEGYDTLIPLGSQGKIITRQALELDEYEHDVVEIENIYEYIEDYCKSKYGNNAGIIIKNSIFYNINKNNEEYSSLFFNSLDTKNLENIYDNNYLIGAIEFCIDFAPNEEVQLVVKYDYKLGSNYYNSSQTFRYYLTPAKYWQDFGKIEINLHLHEDYPRLASSSLEFEKIEKLTYRYISDKLPEDELVVEASYPWLKSVMSNPYIRILSVLMAIALFIIAIVIIIVVVKIKKNKNNDNNGEHVISKKFKLFPFLLITGFLLMSLVRTFLYNTGSENWFVRLARPFFDGGYVAPLLLPIAVVLFIGIVTGKGNGNFLKGLVSVFAILSALLFVILAFVFPASSIVVDGYLSNVPLRNIKFFSLCFHLPIVVFLLAFVSAVIKPKKRSSTRRLYVWTILAVVSILTLTGLQLFGERSYGENYSLLLDCIVSFLSAALPFAFFAYVSPRYDDE